MNFTQKQIKIIYEALICYKDVPFYDVDEDYWKELEKLTSMFENLNDLPEQVHKIMENLNKITKE